MIFCRKFSPLSSKCTIWVVNKFNGLFPSYVHDGSNAIKVVNSDLYRIYDLYLQQNLKQR